MRFFRSKSAPQFILMIGDEGVLFVPHKVAGETKSFFAAEGDARAEAAIFSAIRQNPRVPLTLFADILAQDFKRETLPRLNPLDRPKLIERRLRQAFPQAGLTASLNLKRSRTQVLLAALYDGGPIFEWIEKLKAHRGDAAPRIALLPLECADMVSRLVPDTAEGWAMLLSRQRTGGFRQIVTHNSELIFTRLTPPLPASSTAREVADAISRDVKASLGYLGRLGLTDSRELQTILLMPHWLHPALKLAQLPVGVLHLLTPQHAGDEIETAFPVEANEVYSDMIYAGWLVRKAKPQLALMPGDIRKVRHAALIKEWGWRATAAALLLAFGITGWQGGDLINTLLETRQETAQLSALNERLANEQASAAPVTEPLGRLRQAIERRRLFSEPVTTPWAALHELGPGIGGDARLVKFDWRSDDDKPSTDVMEIDLRLSQGAPSSLKDRQAIAAQYQKLAQDVAHDMPDYDVRLTHYPFPALPGEALSNDDAAKNGVKADDTAELALRRIAP